MKDDSWRVLSSVDHCFQTSDRPAPFEEAEDLSPIDIAARRKVRVQGLHGRQIDQSFKIEPAGCVVLMNDIERRLAVGVEFLSLDDLVDKFFFQPGDSEQDLASRLINVDPPFQILIVRCRQGVEQLGQRIFKLIRVVRPGTLQRLAGSVDRDFGG